MASEQEKINPIIHIRGLNVRNSRLVILHNLDLDIYSHDLLGLAGESGGGKTILIRTILNILPSGIEWDADELTIFGQDARYLSDAQRRQINGDHIGFIPQNTVNYLHPMMKIKSQIIESYVLHGHGTRQEGMARAAQLLGQVGLSDPERILNSYAWELSGGMRQRVNIAMALMNKPELLIADEPTTALDAVVQRQILELFKELHEKTGVAILMISHDLGMLELYSSRCMVMYAGRMVEIGPTGALFAAPEHPYTKALLRVVPSLKPVGDERLSEIPGFVPDSGRDTDSCIFMPRCAYAQDVCRDRQTLRDLGDGHMCLCCRAGSLPYDAGGGVQAHGTAGAAPAEAKPTGSAGDTPAGTGQAGASDVVDSGIPAAEAADAHTHDAGIATEAHSTADDAPERSGI